MAENFKFKLSLYNKQNTINPISGLSLSDLSEIIKAVSTAVELEDIHCTLNSIENSSQTMIFVTQDRRGHDNFTNLMERVRTSEGKLSSLSPSQQDFGRILVKYTKKGVCFAGFNNQDVELLRIERYLKELLPKYYFEIDEINGKIIEIGGRNEDKPHILVKDSYDNLNLIYISEKQDGQLSKYYKRLENMSFIVKFKYDFSTRSILDAELKSFYVPGNYDFYLGIEEVNKKYPSIFSELTDPVHSILEARKSNND